MDWNGNSIIARDAPGWSMDDPDLRHSGLTGDETVILGITSTADYPNIDDELDDYTAMIQSGRWPPVWVWSDDVLITGQHRLTAAHRLGMDVYPAVIVE